jgi:hypothetical protein
MARYYEQIVNVSLFFLLNNKDLVDKLDLKLNKNLSNNVV